MCDTNLKRFYMRMSLLYEPYHAPNIAEFVNIAEKSYAILRFFIQFRPLTTSVEVPISPNYMRQSF